MTLTMFVMFKVQVQNKSSVSVVPTKHVCSIIKQFVFILQNNSVVYVSAYFNKLFNQN